MNFRTQTIFGGCIAAALHAQAFGGAILGAALPFAVVGDSTVTNTGLTVMAGDRGIWPSTAFIGFPPRTAYALMLINDAIGTPAETEAQAAIASLIGVASSLNRTGRDAGEMSLTAGAFSFESSAQLTGTLTLGTETPILGAIVAQTNITLTTGVTIYCGPAMALNAPHARDLASVNVTPVLSVPAPLAAAMGLVGCGAMGLTRRRRAELLAS